jgi:hypothetical protein
VTVVSASQVHPSYLTWLGVGRELTTAAAVVPSGALPLEPGSYDPEDTPKFLPDQAIRGSMVFMYNEILGPTSATFSYGGPMYLDTEGYMFDNIFGDLSSTGIPSGSATTTSQALSIGATSSSVSSLSGFTANSIVQLDTGSVAEVVIVSSTAGTVLNFTNNPLRFAHSTSASVQTVTGPYTHKFAALNTGSGQPPTHTFTDYTGVTPSVGARAYVSACVSQLDFTGNSEQLLMWKVTGNTFQSAAASTAPSVFTSFVVPVAAWRGTANLGGTANYDFAEWAVSMKRKVQIYWTAQNNNNPLFIARGPLDATGTLNYAMALGTDESPLTYMLNNTQPSFNVTTSNGLAGTAQLSLGFTTNQAAIIKSKPVRSGELFTYNDEFQTIGNATDVGGSGGLGPCTVTLINNLPSY